MEARLRGRTPVWEAHEQGCGPLRPLAPASWQAHSLGPSPRNQLPASGQWGPRVFFSLLHSLDISSSTSVSAPYLPLGPLLGVPPHTSQS